MNKLLNKIKHIAPWCVAIAIFAYLFKQYPPSQVWEALRLVNVPAFVGFVISYFLFMYVIDSYCMQRVITKFSHPVKFKDIFVARGVTYLIMVINYPASQAAFAYYLRRKYGIAIFEALGIFLYILFIDLLWLITMAFIASFFIDISVAGLHLADTVRTATLIAYAFTFIWIAFWRKLPERIFGRHIKLPIIEGFRDKKVFHIFDKAKVADYLKVALMRSPIHIAIIFFMYVVLWTFGTTAPIVKIMGNVPIVFLIGTLPITPGGLGTVNAAMVALLHTYVTGPVIESGRISAKELIFTSTLLWMFANYTLKMTVGTILLRSVSKDLFKPTEDVPEEEAEREAAHIGGDL